MVVSSAAKKSTIRDQVVAAATRLFAARGFDATPLQDIADAVGVSKPAVLHHFPTKEHIRRGVLDSILTHWRDELPRLLLAATASDERFDSVLDEVYRFFAKSPERARFIVREAMDRPAQARDMLRSIAPILRGIAGYIRTGLGDREADIDPDAYVLHVMQMVIGAAAVAEVTTAMLGSDADGQARYDRELARIARSSLFGRRRTSTAATRDPAPRPPTKRRRRP
jgi:TetR/AcrR family transcriptional regulator